MEYLAVALFIAVMATPAYIKLYKLYRISKDTNRPWLFKSVAWLCVAIVVGFVGATVAAFQGWMN